MKPATNWIWTFISITESRRYQRWAKNIEEEFVRLSLSPKDGLILKSILLVEMSQRSIIWRVIERAIDLIQAGLHIPRRLTLGPFQMHHAPLCRKKQVAQAIQLLTSVPRSSQGMRICDVARFWNGSAGCQHGSSMSYADALRLAIRVLSVSTSR